MGLVKIVLSLLANLLGFMKDRQLIEAGKAEAKNEQAEKTAEVISDLNRPRSAGELDELWERNKAKYRQ